MKLKFKLLPLFIMLHTCGALADSMVQMYAVDENGIGSSIGQVSISESKYGMVFTPSLKGLTPGMHGFHLHQKPSCESKEKEGKMVPALAAGGHYDPLNTNRHDTPWGKGHLGDLPAIFVDSEGKASQPVLAPRLRAKDIKGRSLMVHVGGDNHADHPEPVGGGGERLACGIIDK